MAAAQVSPMSMFAQPAALKFPHETLPGLTMVSPRSTTSELPQGLRGRPSEVSGTEQHPSQRWNGTHRRQNASTEPAAARRVPTAIRANMSTEEVASRARYGAKEVEQA